MIAVNNIVKAFDGFRALDDLTLTVPAGGVYGLVGPNGSGKSTLIRHLAGIYRQDSGSILLDGQEVFDNPALKERIAYIPDEPHYFMSATTEDMLEFYRSVYKHYDMSRWEKLRAAFQVDIKTPIRRLSKGLQKQSALMLMLCICPDYILLDEPVDGLDPVMRRQVWGIILDDVSARGVTVLVSSHNLRELEDVCDHVGILHHGKLLLERSLLQLQDNIAKVQIAFADDAPVDLSNLSVLHQSRTGRVNTLIVRGDIKETQQLLATKAPLFCDMLPLTLEEIFIYELGGVDYEVKSIVL